MTSSPLILRSLYRSLWRATKPFTPPAATAVPFQCLLDRTGVEDPKDVWFSNVMGNNHENDKPGSKEEERTMVQQAFRRLLKQLIAGENATPPTTTTTAKDDDDTTTTRHMVFPRDVDPYRLRRLLQREYRGKEDAVSAPLDPKWRQELAFLTLRKLNAKLSFVEDLWHRGSSTSSKGQPPEQATTEQQSPLQSPPLPPPWNEPVIPLPASSSSSSYLQPGTFLIAHPSLSGYFRRSVICIVHHYDDNDSASLASRGTYGLMVNRVCVVSSSDQQDHPILTFGQALDPLPDDIAQAFGQAVVRDGGPVHSSLQMLHKSSTDDEDVYKIGGQVLEPHPDLDTENNKSSSTTTTIVIKYRGDVKHAAAAVISDKLPADDFTFFVGASAWTVGQLESEIRRGFWLPCAAPVTLAQGPTPSTSTPTPTSSSTLEAMDDFYLQVLAACGPQEAALANLVRHDDNEDHPFRKASDDFS